MEAVAPAGFKVHYNLTMGGTDDHIPELLDKLSRYRIAGCFEDLLPGEEPDLDEPLDDREGDDDPVRDPLDDREGDDDPVRDGVVDEPELLIFGCPAITCCRTELTRPACEWLIIRIVCSLRELISFTSASTCLKSCSGAVTINELLAS